MICFGKLKRYSFVLIPQDSFSIISRLIASTIRHRLFIYKAWKFFQLIFQKILPEFGKWYWCWQTYFRKDTCHRLFRTRYILMKIYQIFDRLESKYSCQALQASCTWNIFIHCWKKVHYFPQHMSGCPFDKCTKGLLWWTFYQSSGIYFMVLSWEIPSFWSWVLWWARERFWWVSTVEKRKENSRFN